MADLTMDISKVRPGFDIHVKLRGAAIWRFRIWLAASLMRFAARLMRASIEIEVLSARA